MNVLFFTGFPGFIGRRLVKALDAKFNYDKIYLLVEPRMIGRAESEVSEMPDPSKFEIVEGDITQKDLGISEKALRSILPQVTHLFHLAAIYDLTVEWERAYRVNVIGTQNVVDFAAKSQNLRRFVYFSTAYVSGLRIGTVYEDELVEPPGFKNHYEHTKFLAEQVVRQNMDSIPTTIIRPGIVIGDSKTGETDKFDGPYFVMVFFKRVPKFLPLPYIGKGEAEVNIVPIDFIIEATVALTESPDAEGKTFHLTDPNPLTARELYRLFSLKIRGKEPFGTVPLKLVQMALKVKPIAKLFGVPYEATPYFEHKVHYDPTNARNLLEPKGIKVPPLRSYVDKIVQFFLSYYGDPKFTVF